MPTIVNIILGMKRSHFLADPQPERSKLRRKPLATPKTMSRKLQPRASKKRWNVRMKNGNLVSNTSGDGSEISWVGWDFPVSQHGKFECKGLLGKIQLGEGTFSTPSWVHQGFCF